jgi:hypothetical protein
MLVRRMRLRDGLLFAVVLAGATASVWGSGPRYVTGPPFFTGKAGVAIGWKQANLMYFTDPGDLGPAVNHAAADALVAAAAGVWNVPVASITVGQGGALAEHVSGQNVYLSSDGMVWPSDVMSSNDVAVPIAIVYDTDGSVTETLLGAGASDPSGCAQNAVTESVDTFDPAGYILHAIVVLNGRCTGAAPEQQLQMQYQLERVFGRVLGLAWSQTNDNVFTGTPLANYDQEAHWPIMHPMEILCGPYSYQCLPNAFALRPDDVAGLVWVYPIVKGATPAAGKQVSLSAANALTGSFTFPNGEGMEGVNVLVTRGPRFSNIEQDWIETSTVSGSSFRRSGLSPFVSADATAGGSFGTLAVLNQGYYFVPYFEVTDPFGSQTEVVTMEPVNPLYIGSASVGPYAPGMVAVAGSAPTPYVWIGAGPVYVLNANFAISGAPAGCGNGTDGTLAAPMTLPVSGWWSGLVCAYGHASYVAATVQAGRSLTVEVTALDVNGFATTTKAMPVIGLFAPTDGTGSLPSLAAAPAAFQALGMGTTTLSATPFAAGGAGGVVRIGIADQRGDGRPDFAYQARLFYADSLLPAVVASGGGAGTGTTVTILGTGFRAGNAVMVNGVAAVVVSWTANAIVMTPPTMTAAGAVSGMPLDVEVIDLGTGATSTMTAALSYDKAAQLPNTMLLVSAPAGPVFVGDTAPVAFAVRVLASDAVTPVAGDTVVFSLTAGKAQFAACVGKACSVKTDSNGMASTMVSPTAAGAVTMQASDGALTESASFSAVLKPGVMKLVQAPSGNVPVGQLAAKSFMVQMLTANGSTGLAGQLVTFTVPTGSATFSGCNATPCSVTTNVSGQASVGVTPSTAGSVTIEATDGSLTQQVSFTAVPNANVLTLLTVPSAVSYVGQSAGALNVLLTKSDGLTGIPYVPLVFTAPVGVTFSACGSNNCVVDTQWNGGTGTAVATTVTGTFLLQVAYGSVVVTTSIQSVAAPTMTVRILSAPSGTLSVGTTSPIPFTVQVIGANGKPMSGDWVNIGGGQGVVVAGCGAGNCMVISDANGMATTSITPIEPGTIVLAATCLSGNATTSFTATGPGESWTTVSSPPRMCRWVIR